MIQFIPKGPQIPQAIQKALIQDKLVLFCGAGISRQNGLPLFQNLIKQLCKKLNVDIAKEPLLKTAYEKDYAGVLDLLEGDQKFSVKPEDLRKYVIEILNNFEGEPEIHKDLLELSALPNGRGHRLVTTNFDRLFFKAKPDLKWDSAPKLAPPRKGKWTHLTFLHGVIDEENDPEGSNLILTRSDIGLAYLHDAWATRFIIQLFQDWTVLFVGYSVNDPVMTYLVSAISAENKRKKDNNASRNHDMQHSTPSIYAFAGYKEGNQKEEENKWKSLGIEPIPYKIQENEGADSEEDHSLLYKTIEQWADLKKSGLSGEKRFLKEKLRTPFKEDTDGERAETVISLLKTNERLAEYFPKINLLTEIPATIEKNNKAEAKKLSPDGDTKSCPVDISWLKAFSETESNLLIKLTRPSNNLWEPLSHFERNMAQWLCCHLDKKELIHALIETEALLNNLITLHPDFKRMIDSTLKRANLDKRKERFWKILTTQKDSSRDIYEDRWDIINLNENYSLPQAKRLFESLEPKIGFEIDFYHKALDKTSSLDKIYEPKLTIQESYPDNRRLTNETALLSHAEDFTNLLKRAMELAEYAGIIQKGNDTFLSMQRSSIAEHAQNTRFSPLTFLIDLTRDSFDKAMQKKQKLALSLLEKWKLYPYSIFYRLILYAVTKYKTLDEAIAFELLVNNKADVLWSISCQNEVLRYLERKGRHLKQAVKKLVFLIMKGPPRSLYRKVDEKEFIEEKERDIYKRLKCLKISGAPLPEDAETYYKEIQSKYNLPKKMGDSDYFPFYSFEGSSSGDSKFFHDKPIDEIVNIIEQPSSILHQEQGSEVQLLRKEGEFRSLSMDFPEKAWDVLLRFEDKNKKNAPAWAWGSFFSGLNSIVVLSDRLSYKNNKTTTNTEKNSKESAKKADIEKRTKLFMKALKKVESFSDDFLKHERLLSPLVGVFYEKRGLTFFYENKDYFKTWWLRLWGLSLESCKPSNEKDSYSLEALNANTGKLTQIVFRILWNLVVVDKKIPKEGKIPPLIKDYYFDIILKESSKNPSHLFYYFGSDLSKLWHLDREWTVNNLKPLMGRRNPNTTPAQKSKETLNPKSKDMIQHSGGIRKAFWEGYLLRDQFLGPDFLIDFKKEFFNLIMNYKSILKDNTLQSKEYLYAIARIFFISTGGLNIENIFNKEEPQKLACYIDKDLLETLSQYILDLFKNSEKDKSAYLWSYKIKPWIEKFWPNQKNKNSPEIAKNLSLIVLCCENSLPDAFNLLKHKIQNEIQGNNHFIVYDICEQWGLTKASDFELNESLSMKDEVKRDNSLKKNENKMKGIFDYPKQLLEILDWNLPEDRILYDASDNTRKILDKLKKLNPEIENEELFKKLEDKLEN